MSRLRLRSALALVGTLAIPALTNGCGDDNPLCCNEFKAGATIGAEIGGSAQAQVAVQAVADFAGIANAAITDLASACRSIAEDLDADKATLDKVETDANAAKADDAQKIRMEGYCQAAISAIGTVKGQAGIEIKVNVQPPQCSASVSAKANCQAKCDVSGKCDIKANPPQCTGGKLEISCKGGCTGEAGASIACEGSCDANCEGECTGSPGGVECKGKCEGTCKGQAEGGTGTGIQADGSCDGTCEGSCKATAPNVQCKGSCKGSCSGSCKATAGASVKCDGKCDGDFEPLKCEGGTLEGGCKVDAKCDANCDASVSAKAECTPPAITLDIVGQASGEAGILAVGKLKATLEANMGVVFAFKSRLEGMAKLTATITGNASAIGDIKAACIPQVVIVGTKAVADITASASVTGNLVGSVQ